jgi:hypothetical protein
MVRSGQIRERRFCTSADIAHRIALTESKSWRRSWSAAPGDATAAAAPRPNSAAWPWAIALGYAASSAAHFLLNRHLF